MRRGIMNFEKLLDLERRGLRKLHRHGKSTLTQRYKKKLVGKTTWFRSEEEKMAGNWQESNTADRKQNQKPRLQYQDPVSVLFVDRSPEGQLITRLREKEREMQTVSGRKVKLVEKTGDQLKSLIWKSDPLGGIECWDLDCVVCQEETERQICRKKNVVYTSTCLKCKEKGETWVYVGETSRSLAERAGEHRQDLKDEKEHSHMFTHREEKHQGEEQVRMKFSVAKVCRSALERQVRETVCIKLLTKEGAHLLNNKIEYNRCLIPEITMLNSETKDEDKPQNEHKKKKKEEIEHTEEQDLKYRKRTNLDDGTEVVMRKKRRKNKPEEEISKDMKPETTELEERQGRSQERFSTKQTLSLSQSQTEISQVSFDDNTKNNPQVRCEVNKEGHLEDRKPVDDVDGLSKDVILPGSQERYTEDNASTDDNVVIKEVILPGSQERYSEDKVSLEDRKEDKKIANKVGFDDNIVLSREVNLPGSQERYSDGNASLEDREEDKKLASKVSFEDKIAMSKEVVMPGSQERYPDDNARIDAREDDKKLTNKVSFNDVTILSKETILSGSQERYSDDNASLDDREDDMMIADKVSSQEVSVLSQEVIQQVSYFDNHKKNYQVIRKDGQQGSQERYRRNNQEIISKERYYPDTEEGGIQQKQVPGVNKITSSQVSLKDNDMINSQEMNMKGS